MDAAELVLICEAWVSMGSAVQDQVRSILEEGPEAECNPNAVHVAKEALSQFKGTEAVDDILSQLTEWEQPRISK